MSLLLAVRLFELDLNEAKSRIKTKKYLKSFILHKVHLLDWPTYRNDRLFQAVRYQTKSERIQIGQVNHLSQVVQFAVFPGNFYASSYVLFIFVCHF